MVDAVEVEEGGNSVVLGEVISATEDIIVVLTVVELGVSVVDMLVASDTVVGVVVAVLEGVVGKVEAVVLMALLETDKATVAVDGEAVVVSGMVIGTVDE